MGPRFRGDDRAPSACFPPPLARYKSSGGWRWTSHSPTGSGPEGSSPNEHGSGRSSASHPFSAMISASQRGRQSDGTMSETVKPSDQGPGEAPEGAGYRVLARKYRPASFDDLIGQDAMVRTVSNAFESGRIPQAWILTGVRGVGKTTTARILARALNYELPDGSITAADHPHAGDGRALPGHHREPPHRRLGNGRRLAQFRRGRAPDQRRHPLRAGVGALQGLHPRRSAHALGRGVQRAAQDAGRAAAARQVHLRHHRNPQSAGDGAVALSALRSAPRRRRAVGQASRRHRRQGEDRGRAGGAGA